MSSACIRVSPPPGAAPEEAAPAPPPPVVQVIREPLVPEDLAGRVAIRNYRYQEGEEDDVRISFTVENLTVNETFLLEARSIYYDRQGEVLSESAWSRFELEPGRRHHYFSRVPARGVGSGRGFLRRVVDRDAPGEPDAGGP